MIRVKKIKPMFTMVVTTADKYADDTTEGGVITRQGGTLKEFQKVIAIGSSVREIKVGDLVKVDPTRFAVHKRDKNSLANDVEGGNPILGYKFDFIEIDDVLYMKLQDRDIEYVVEEYEEEEDTPMIVTTPKLIVPEKKTIIL